MWNPASGALKKLGELGATPTGAKAETLLVLEQQPQRYRVLVMHDGSANGAADGILAAARSSSARQVYAVCAAISQERG